MLKTDLVRWSLRWQTMGYETTSLGSLVNARGAPAADSRAPFLGRLYPATLPNPAGQWAQAAPCPDRPAARLCHTERTQCHSGLPHPGAGLSPAPVPPPQAHPVGARCCQVRAATRLAAHLPPHLWQAAQYLDASVSRRSLLGMRLDPRPGEYRDHSSSAQASGRELAAGQTLDYQPRSPVCAKKKRRDRLMHRAAQHPDGVLGFVDETWWSRLAQPALQAWTAGKPLPLPERVAVKGDPDPKARCGDGMLRTDREPIWRRLVEGRPVRQVTTTFLRWLCQWLGVEQKKNLVLIWENASWLVSRQVRTWIQAH